ncbi:hypothetical protein HPP92_001598 [Vanilla planifolia]|uniref:Uncharacterized protein n=1 Tax=Vanilla planifolia TaxID=51239 RepID=A0A835S809_VANPL|nr:hypothetical protein HPP92_001598 [Vanilla planifolia]
MKWEKNEEQAAYILMQRIFPTASVSYLVREGICHKNHAVSELGIYGAYLRSKDKVIMNDQCGYLVRTKHSSSNEGGVAARICSLGQYIFDLTLFHPMYQCTVIISEWQLFVFMSSETNLFKTSNVFYFPMQRFTLEHTRFNIPGSNKQKARYISVVKVNQLLDSYDPARLFWDFNYDTPAETWLAARLLQSSFDCILLLFLNQTGKVEDK